MQINNAGESKCSDCFNMQTAFLLLFFIRRQLRAYYRNRQNILLPCMRKDVRQVWSLSHWFLKGCYRKLVVLIISIVVTSQRTLTDKPLL